MLIVKAIKANLIYLGKPGEVIENAYLLWDDKVVKGIVKERPKGIEEVFEFDKAVITPAFIDAHCHIGMARAGEPDEERESNERMDSVLPLIDALYSVYLDDPSFKEAIEWGVLYSCVLPGSGNVIGGRGVIIRNYGLDIEDAFIKYAGVKMALGFNPRKTVDWKGIRPFTRMGVIGLLKKWLIKAKDMLKLVEEGKKLPEEIEPEIRALFPVIKGEEILRVHVHRADDIAGLIMLMKEFKFKATIEHAHDLYKREHFEKIKKANIPLVYGPIDSFPYKTELKHATWRNVKYLVEVKPFFGIMSDHPVVLQRNLFMQLRFFRVFGMSKSECISLITYNNAKILGINDILGSLEKGKWASFVVWNEDPFNLGSYPIMVVAEGRIIHEVK